VRTFKQTIWVADDEAATRSYLADFLSARGYSVLCLDSGEHVVSRLQPSNAAMKPIIVPARSVQIQGRVIGVLRKY